MGGNTPDMTDWLARAKAIAPVIERDASAVEKDTRISRTIHEALVAQDLYWMLLPREFGGDDADVRTCIETIEEIARADGATGWTYFVNIATIGGLFPFLHDEALDALFQSVDRPIMAGQLVPKGRSEKTVGGYLCSGQHNFASGSAFANWICATQIEYSGDAQVVGPDNMPRATIALLKRDEVEFQCNWDVMGLSGTASYDYRVPSQLVPAGRILDGAILSPTTVPLRGSAMLRMGALALAYAMHTACVLGIAKHAMQEIVKLASAKSRPGYAATVSEDPVFLNEFALFDAEYHAVRSRLIEVFVDAEIKVRNGSALSSADHAVLRQTATWAHRRAGEIGAFAFRWAGTTPVRNPSVLGRCMRDILVANSHMLFDAKTLTDAAPEVLQRWAI